MRAAKPNRAMAVKPLRATPFTALQPSQSNQQKADNLLATKPDSSIYCRQHHFTYLQLMKGCWRVSTYTERIRQLRRPRYGKSI